MPQNQTNYLSGELFMNKKILLTFLLLSQFSLASNRKNSFFTCTLDLAPRSTFTFSVSELGTSNMTMLLDEQEQGPVFTKSKSEIISRLVDTLNGQGGDIRVNEKGILLFGDNAGCDIARLQLYKESGFTRGWVRTEHSCSGPNDKGYYSKVSCELE